jgi:predicted 3-demethylubiquinone-9 3-methyltransferase (glyoxalase superfamily)
MPKISQRITPFLWFENRAEEAARFYTSVFPNSKIVTTTRYTEPGAQAARRPAGSVMTVVFRLGSRTGSACPGKSSPRTSRSC